nr:serine protease SPPA, chloroplastic-like [Tanacetum cinerariifolium]
MGDRIVRKNISEENREMLTKVLDNIYWNWVDKISQAKGKKKEEIETFINEGVYHIEKLKEGGWITDIKYDDEVRSMLKTRLGIAEKKKLPLVAYKKYSKVGKSTLGLSGGEDKIAVIRASGGINRVEGSFFSPSSGIVAEKFIEKIRKVRESKRYKAVIIRIDSPGGDALASDFITGSIGVVRSKFNFGKLYEKIGFNKEVISKGQFSEVNASHRSFRPEEEKVFANSTQKIYKEFRDKAACSRSMSEIAQGRVWTGNDAASRGLVDAIGGFSRAVAIAKHKANIPQDKKFGSIVLSISLSSL